MKLDKNEISVWQVDIDKVDTSGDLSETLSDDEIQRAYSFRFAADRKRFIARRAILRTLLGRYLSVDPAEIRFSENSSGKPQVAFPQQPGLRFSLSHSGNLLAFAHSPDPEIGIDIEKIDSATDLEDVAKTYFSPAEQTMLDDLPEPARVQAFFRIWTLKEAVVKASELNLEDGLRSLNLADAHNSSRIDTILGDGRVVSCLSGVLDAPGYASALAMSAQPNAPITLHRYLVNGDKVIESFKNYPPA
ncbi:MAG TPA: 4'-phosphopantetheinyl transferase superfamily protein [Chlorobaculum sp.]|nr:4'-phosphopantetheinyl transferase superfamily protein [Chlorobaculum sp.]